MLKSISLIASLLFIFVIGTANAQENPYAIETKVIKNDQAIQNLRQQQADLYLKIENLLVKYGELKGQLEVMSHKLDYMESKLDKLNSYNRSSALTPAPNNTLSSVQGGYAIDQQRSNVPIKGGIKKSSMKNNSAAGNNNPKAAAAKDITSNDKNDYLAAKKMYDSKNYDKAIKLFENFKVKYKNSEFMPNAIFYIAQSQFKKGDYDKAIVNYDYLINTYPKSNKVAAALLKEGISFVKLGDNIDGKYLLKKTMEKYPNSNEAKTAKQVLSKLK